MPKGARRERCSLC
ncbi:hypothetical protein DMC61_03900 [Amycolatopsis sp. WAC 04169]|nr:hypothetical protein DMC61_03900 [Amycolatopsis sp. WAC 04169]